MTGVAGMLKRCAVKTMLSVTAGTALALAPLSASGAAYTQPAAAGEWQPWYTSPKPGVMLGVAAFGPRDIWAVGAPDDYSLHPMVVRWDGNSWHNVTVAGASGYRLTNIAASAANDVWVFGTGKTKDQAFRWDGARWHTIPLPAEGIGMGNPAVLSATSAWITGQSGCRLPSPHSAWDCTTHVYHWNGRAWQLTSIHADVYGLAASSAANVWAVAIAPPHGSDFLGPLTAYRWDGARWAPVAMPHPQAGGDPSIATTSPRDVWIGASAGDVAKDYVLHWNGVRWDRIGLTANVGATVAGAAVTPDGYGGVWYGWWAHWTGGVWVNSGATAPPLANLVVTQLVRVPGTAASYVGSAYTARPSANHGDVVVYGPIP